MGILVAFSGPVTYRYDHGTPLPLQLRGIEGGVEGTIAIAQFAGTVPDNMPSTMYQAELEAPPDLFDSGSRSTLRTFFLNVAGKRYSISASRLVLHRDVRELIRTVIPARKVRWRTRVFWRAVFELMRLPFGRRLLLSRYRS